MGKPNDNNHEAHFNGALDSWKEDEKAGFEFINVLGKLFYDSSVELIFFRSQLVDRSASVILNKHSYAKTYIGKTPVCLYLALKFGILAANYPITDEDLMSSSLPKAVAKFKNKLFGLMISAERLHEIRQLRQPDSNYASMQKCRQELKNVENIYTTAQIPYLHSTNFSIEEIATKIMQIKKIKRQI